MKEVASLRYGVIFKKAFCDVEIFKAFVHDILGIDIEIDTVETEKTFSIPVGRVQPRFDLYAEDKKNRIIVDIQHEHHPDHYDRFLYYHCVALIEQITQSLEYRPKLKVFTIVVLTSGDRSKKDVSQISFDPHDLDGKPLGRIEHKVIFLCPKYLNERTPEPYREWMLAIKDSLDEQVDESRYRRPEVLKIFQHIEKELVQPDERARVMEDYLRSEKMKRKHEKGIEIGEQIGKLRIVQHMLANGMSLADIVKMTGLDESTITELITKSKEAT